MPYEDGMSVSYDAVTKKVTVFFRGQKTVLPGEYATQEAGRKAGEEWCRARGWKS
jgi:hypothetical protein